MSYTPGPQDEEELKRLKPLLDAIGEAWRPAWRRVLDWPCFAAIALGQVARQRWAEWRAR